MSRYSILNEKTNQALSYGFDDELGYFYDVVDLNFKETDKEYMVEEKYATLDNLKNTELAKILDDWDAPREHLLAVVLSQPF